jgi:Flp pilus assembly pilin Flp
MMDEIKNIRLLVKELSGRGQTVAEYVLIMTLISLAVLLLLKTFALSLTVIFGLAIRSLGVGGGSIK